MADEIKNSEEIIVDENKKFKIDKAKIKKAAIVGGCALVAAGIVVVVAKSGSNEIVETAAQVAETVA